MPNGSSRGGRAGGGRGGAGVGAGAGAALALLAVPPAVPLEAALPPVLAAAAPPPRRAPPPRPARGRGPPALDASAFAGCSAAGSAAATVGAGATTGAATAAGGATTGTGATSAGTAGSTGSTRSLTNPIGMPTARAAGIRHRNHFTPCFHSSLDGRNPYLTSTGRRNSNTAKSIVRSQANSPMIAVGALGHGRK